mmetsp:Transcript_10145/g.15083  ORF Transcript_10145/g.15083 Transcript_10145/m.15083 type:complete len:525 (-) Transcript_10145:98-1672(-)
MVTMKRHTKDTNQAASYISISSLMFLLSSLVMVLPCICQNHGYVDAFQVTPSISQKNVQESSLLSLAKSQKRKIYYHNNQIIKNRSSINTKTSSSTTTYLQATVTFSNPLLDEGYPPTVHEYKEKTLTSKPLLLYVPGFDGTNVAPFLQYPELSTIFDVRCMRVSMSDRSTFEDLRDGIFQYLEETLLQNEEDGKVDSKNYGDVTEEQVGGKNNGPGGFLFNLFGGGNGSNKNNTPTSKKSIQRPIYIMGESFGGILALEVALSIISSESTTATNRQEPKLDLSQNLKGLVLVNPATCYDRSALASKGPSVVSLPKFLYPLGVLSLIPLFTDEYALPQLGLMLSSKALPSVIDTPEREAYMGRNAFSLPSKLQYMPQGTLEWRLEQWLRRGCEDVSIKLKNSLNSSGGRRKKIPPVLLVAGEKDGTLPSIAEAERLLGLLPDCAVHVVEGAGHACTCGSRVDIAALMRARFKELQQEGGRIAMKQVAAEGEGINFGLEPRYDGASVGLLPTKYWSEKYYQKIEK